MTLSIITTTLILRLVDGLVVNDLLSASPLLGGIPWMVIEAIELELEYFSPFRNSLFIFVLHTHRYQDLSFMRIKISTWGLDQTLHGSAIS